MCAQVRKCACVRVCVWDRSTDSNNIIQTMQDRPENFENLYKKALNEIKKLYEANIIMKEQTESGLKQMGDQNGLLRNQCDSLEQSLAQANEDKQRLENYVKELQDSYKKQQKEHQELDCEWKYLYGTLSEQRALIARLNSIQDEKGFAALLLTYEERENLFKDELRQKEQNFTSLNSRLLALEAEISSEKKQRQQMEIQLIEAKQEVIRFQELNGSLMRHAHFSAQSIVSREGEEKAREVEEVINVFKQQLEEFKIDRMAQSELNRHTVDLEIYEEVLHDNNRLSNENSRMKGAYSSYQERLNNLYDVEEKLKVAQLRIAKKSQECNMLKSKVITLETKELMESISDEEIKISEGKVLPPLIKADPLNSIRNSDESSHFSLMKAFVTQLKEKLHTVDFKRKKYEHKYRHLKETFAVNTQKMFQYEKANRLLKGKAEASERLLEKLQNQLERIVHLHKEEIQRIKLYALSIVEKRSEEHKLHATVIKMQLEGETEKYEKSEKYLRQELSTIKLQLATERIKSKDFEEQAKQASEVAALFRSKLGILEANLAENEYANAANGETLEKYEQLYKEERIKTEAYMLQKQSLATQVNELSEELARRKQECEDKLRTLQTTLEGENKKLKAELAKTKTQTEEKTMQLRAMRKQLDDQVKQSEDEAEGTKKQSGYFTLLEKNYHQECHKTQELETTLERLRLKQEKDALSKHKLADVEEELLAKTQELNDLKRKLLLLEKQSSVLGVQNSQLNSAMQTARKEADLLRCKIGENAADLRRDTDGREIEWRRTVNKLNQELVAAGAELREEKKNGVRLHTELAAFRMENHELQDQMEQLRNRQVSMSEQLFRVRNEYQTLSQDSERLRSEVRSKATALQTLGNEASGMEERIFRISQELASMKTRLKSAEQEKGDVSREVSNLKIYLPEVEEYISRLRKTEGLSWQEQRETDSVLTLVQKVKKLLRINDVTIANEHKYLAEYSFDPKRQTDSLV